MGDLLLIAEEHGTDQLVRREALLLQMKVGIPTLSSTAPIVGTNAQGEFYASWPSFNWSAKLREMLPGPFPRRPEADSRFAAKFAVIPTSDSLTWSSYEAFQIDTGPQLGSVEAVQRLMARVACLSLGVDATPVARPHNGWARIVQDMIDAAPLYTFRGQSRFHSGLDPAGGGFGGIGAVVADTPNRNPRAGFLIVQIGLGPGGRFD
jgi:hypothetical protein